MRANMLSSVIAVIAAAIILMSCDRQPFEQQKPAVGDQAPAISVADLSGKMFRLADHRGKVVLVNFWATNCAICVQEMPALAQLHSRLAARGLATVAVAMPYDRPDHVLYYARRNPLPFPVALDPMGEVAKAFGPVRGTPTLLVIDRGGTIVRKFEGAIDIGRLGADLERTLEAG